MEYLLCYDIVEDDLRQRVADLCMAKGLIRIQYSVFFGIISPNKAETLLMRIKDEIKNKDAAILLVQLCQNCAKKKKIVIETKSKEETASNKTKLSDSSSSQKKSSNNSSEISSKNGRKKRRRRKARISLERLKEYENKGVIIL